METKGLWELSAVLECMARIRSLTQAEWAQLTEEEAEIAHQFVDAMTSTAEATKSGLAVRERKNAGSRSDSDSLKTKAEAYEALLGSLRDRTATIKATGLQGV